MDLTLTPEEEGFRDEVRAWLEANHPGPTPEGDDQARFEFEREWQGRLHEGGWAGISWPKEYGGRGASLIEQTIFAAEMARSKAPRPANVLGLVMGGPVVIAHGSEEQKERFLEPILSAEEIWCQGFSEPESGSDLASLKTRAVQENGGWRVTGQKVWTTFAHEAKWCMLLARSDPDAPKHKGLTYFILDMDQDAVDVRPLRQITGEAEFNEIFIEDAGVPDENVVGGVGNGWMVGITTLMHERAGLGAASAVSLRRELDELIALIRERGLSEDPVIRDRVARLQISAEALRLGGLRTLTQTMRTGIPGPEGSLAKW
jgi:alkylation response protein AidB-like acyl-CoA dehydrogenase